MKSLFSKFTAHAQAVLKRAQALAGSNPVTVRDVSLSILAERGSLASELLFKLRVAPDGSPLPLPPALEDESQVTKPIDRIHLAPETKNLLIKAVIAASTFRHSYVGTEHILFAMTQTEAGIKAVKETAQIAPNTAAEHLVTILKSTSKFRELTSPFSVRTKKTDDQKTPALDFFTHDLTSAEQQKRIDPVIGREQETERLIHILSRRTKNNPLLVGDAGVGKTAIVEGLALRIVEGAVPPPLMNKRILALDMASLVAGTTYRGEFESRITQIIEEAAENPNTILFIDELHTIVGAGSASGSLDAANILKPALARGEIRCIGATTFNEFRKHVTADAALERRFRPIFVAEPSRDQSVLLLKGIKRRYETYHHVTIDDDALEAAVDLSVRYITDKKLPDKAIDLLDEAAAAVYLAASDSSFAQRRTTLTNKAKEAFETKRQAVLKEDFKEAWLAKALEEKLTSAIQKLDVAEKEADADKTMPTVTPDTIADVVSRITTIPRADITHTSLKSLSGIENHLSKKIVGQNEAIAAVSRAVRRARSGLNASHRPMASFLFLGPSGVGKTALARILALTLFGKDGFTRIDMSEFSEHFTTSRLIGAPAGYVGYRESGQLTTAVKKQPWQLVLFDEIEKAHPDTTNLLLQILEEGCLTDGSGERIDFTNTIVVMTSNIGLDLFTKQAAIGFETENDTDEATLSDDIKASIDEEVRSIMRPELVNRLDHLLIFNPLTKAAIEKIVRQEIDVVCERLARHHNAVLDIDRAVISAIAKSSFSPEEGARRVRREVARLFTDPLTDHLVKPMQKEVPIRVSLKGDTIHFE
ncbi:MAG: ATP-dependent Clp protease ATP-binding subunit [bacterium]|nr:ATP-dependent Clp protease ATP-binding subunit [bacterium]